MSWTCICGQFNNGLNVACAACKSAVIEPNTYDELTEFVRKREISNLSRNLDDRIEIMSKPSKETMSAVFTAIGSLIEQSETGMYDAAGREALHSFFFNHHKVFIADMDTAERRQWREIMSIIAHYGKSGLLAIEDNERSLKASQKEWLVSSSNPDQSVSDAISAVRVRKERMTKGDKMLASLGVLGVNEDFAKQLTASMTKTASESAVKSAFTFNSSKSQSLNHSALCQIDRHDECMGRFTADGQSNECKCNCHAAKTTQPESTVDEPKPFNPFAK